MLASQVLSLNLTTIFSIILSESHVLKTKKVDKKYFLSTFLEFIF